MLRNDLINLLAEHDNDIVTVSLKGLLVDVDSVTHARGQIVLTSTPRTCMARCSKLLQEILGRMRRKSKERRRRSHRLIVEFILVETP